MDGLPPEVLARLLNNTDPSQIEERTYETVITGYLRRTGGLAFSGKDLAKIEGMPRIAPVVALEHHLRFDGTGYPVLYRSVGRQHTASQIVSIADVFDALRSCRPYRRDLSAEEVLHLLKKGEGTAFSPELLRGFTVIVESAL